MDNFANIYLNLINQNNNRSIISEGILDSFFKPVTAVDEYISNGWIKNTPEQTQQGFNSMFDSMKESRIGRIITGPVNLCKQKGQKIEKGLYAPVQAIKNNQSQNVQQSIQKNATIAGKLCNKSILEGLREQVHKQGIKVKGLQQKLASESLNRKINRAIVLQSKKYAKQQGRFWKHAILEDVKNGITPNMWFDRNAKASQQNPIVFQDSVISFRKLNGQLICQQKINSTGEKYIISESKVGLSQLSVDDIKKLNDDQILGLVGSLNNMYNNDKKRTILANPEKLQAIQERLQQIKKPHVQFNTKLTDYIKNNINTKTDNHLSAPASQSSETVTPSLSVSAPADQSNSNYTINNDSSNMNLSSNAVSNTVSNAVSDVGFEQIRGNTNAKLFQDKWGEKVKKKYEQLYPGDSMPTDKGAILEKIKNYNGNEWSIKERDKFMETQIYTYNQNLINHSPELREVIKNPPQGLTQDQMLQLAVNGKLNNPDKVTPDNLKKAQEAIDTAKQYAAIQLKKYQKDKYGQVLTTFPANTHTPPVNQSADAEVSSTPVNQSNNAGNTSGNNSADTESTPASTPAAAAAPVIPKKGLQSAGTWLGGGGNSGMPVGWQVPPLPENATLWQRITHMIKSFFSLIFNVIQKILQIILGTIAGIGTFIIGKGFNAGWVASRHMLQSKPAKCIIGIFGVSFLIVGVIWLYKKLFGNSQQEKNNTGTTDLSKLGDLSDFQL